MPHWRRDVEIRRRWRRVYEGVRNPDLEELPWVNESGDQARRVGEIGSDVAESLSSAADFGERNLGPGGDFLADGGGGLADGGGDGEVAAVMVMAAREGHVTLVW